MVIPSKATTAATATYFQQHPTICTNTVPTLGWQVSQVGFGSYRVTLGEKAHEQALHLALNSGINLIDSSSNYGDGGAERLIGRVLTEQIDAGKLQREQVVVVSKVGYLQGFNYTLAQQRKKEGRPFPNLVKYAEGLDHCIHPDFLEDQLIRSLERLNLETLDVYLLHNPEYYLSWAKRGSIPVEDARRTYYQRIRLAFQFLEQAVVNGRIQSYGISSNTSPNPAHSYTFTNLAKVWQIANDIRPDHHFRWVQMPMNLLEIGAATEINQPEKQTVLQFAQTHDLAVLINRPLNAIAQESLTRLASVLPPSYPASPEDVSTSVDSCVQLETRFRDKFLSKLKLDDETSQQLMEYLAMGMMLDGHWGGFGTYQNWRDVQTQFILPRSQTAVEFLSSRPDLPPEAALWLDEYVEAANITLAAVSAFYQEQAVKQTGHIWETSVSIDPEWQASTLSQTAVRALRSTAGVSSVLVGMRQQQYVQDVLADLTRPVLLKDRTTAWQQMHDASSFQ
ncbi:Aldo/keto reductase family protein [hydrothermal vent metagenome]|uniref:Aldo/keto reductase family protein n=1 Tax=hydrothermal vent metagenome TaxID=652676 RepID=A0A3B0VJ68_9ZZZZ